MLKSLLAHPLTRDLDINDPQTTLLRRRIVSEKGFLNEIYCEWYRAIASSIPNGPEFVLEIGAGAGFMNRYISPLVASEVFLCSGTDIVCDGTALPFHDNSLRAIVMTDVFHHIPNTERFLLEASRCVRPGGVLVMVEPWLTRWSTFIYSNLHHEPFEPAVEHWEFPKSGPLSGANGALPWIVFDRDLVKFQKQFSGWKILEIKLLMPFSYLLSGGVSLRSFMPRWSFRYWRWFENLFPQRLFAMFAKVTLEKLT